MSEDELVFVLAIGAIAAFPGGVGMWLILIGRPRNRGYPACGACAADVTGAVAGGTCPACRTGLARAGGDPPRRKVRLIRMALGLVLAIGALGTLGTAVVGAIW